MSLLLDALKKAQTRKQASGEAASAPAPTTGVPSPPATSPAQAPQLRIEMPAQLPEFPDLALLPEPQPQVAQPPQDASADAPGGHDGALGLELAPLELQATDMAHDPGTGPAAEPAATPFAEPAAQPVLAQSASPMQPGTGDPAESMPADPAPARAQQPAQPSAQQPTRPTADTLAAAAAAAAAPGPTTDSRRERVNRVLSATRPTVAAPRRASRSTTILAATALGLAVVVAGVLYWLDSSGSSSLVVQNPPPPAPASAPSPTPGQGAVAVAPDASVSPGVAPVTTASPTAAPATGATSAPAEPAAPTASTAPAVGPTAKPTVAPNSTPTSTPTVPQPARATRPPVPPSQVAARPTAPRSQTASQPSSQAGAQAAPLPASAPSAQAAAQLASPVATAGATAAARTDLRLQPGQLGLTAPLDEQLALGYQALREGQLERAGRHYQEALRLDGRNRDALLGLAAVELRGGRLERAADLYRNALILNPRDAEAASGLTLVGGQDPAMAESMLKRIAQDSPDSAQVHFALGSLYARQGRWSAAQDAFFRTVALAPGEPDHHYNLAVSLEHLQQARLATASYERALALAQGRQPQFSVAAVRERLAALQAVRAPGATP